MTCIVGYQTDTCVYIGGDSCASTPYKCVARDDDKVFRVQNFLIGIAGSFRMGQLLRYSLVVEDQRKNQTDYGFMCTTFIDSVRKCFREGGFLKNNTGEESGGSFLVGYRKKLYEICSDYQVGINKENFITIGSGGEYALGSIYNSVIINKEKKPMHIVGNALRSASFFSPYVSAPFKIIRQSK